MSRSHDKHKRDYDRRSSSRERINPLDYSEALKRKQKAIRNYYDAFLITNRVHMHPDYASEWPKFYNERTRQLISAGLDPSCYDYTMSYQKYFRNLLIEKCKNDVEEAKVTLFIRFCNNPSPRSDEMDRSHGSSGHHSRKRSPSRSLSPVESRHKKSRSTEVQLNAEQIYELSIKHKLEAMSKNEKIETKVIEVCKELLDLGFRFKIQENKVTEILTAAKNAEQSGTDYLMKISEFNYLRGASSYLQNEMKKRPGNFSRRSRKLPGKLRELVKKLQASIKRMEAKEVLDQKVSETIKEWKKKRELTYQPKDVLANSVSMRGPSSTFNPRSVQNLKIIVRDTIESAPSQLPTASEVSNEELIELFKDFESSTEYELKFVQKIMEEIEATDKARYEVLQREMESIQNKFEGLEDGEIASD